MFPLPMAILLKQQAGKRGILWDCASLAYASGCVVSFACGKSIKATSAQENDDLHLARADDLHLAHAADCDKSIAVARFSNPNDECLASY